MTITYTIDGVGGSEADVSVAKLAEVNLIEMSTGIVKVQGADSASETVYALGTATDAAHQATLTIQSKLVKKGPDGPVRTSSFWLSSWIRASDGVNPDVLRPVRVGITFNVPMDIQFEAADVRLMLENLYSATYHELVTKEPNDIRLARLIMFGSTRCMGW